MRELYYAIYKRPDYKTLLYTSIAEAIVYRNGKFNNGKFVIKNKTGLFPREKQVLSKIRINAISHFHFSDLFAWFEVLVRDCIGQNYFIKIFGFHLKTFKFKKDIKKNLNTNFNANIVRFIEDGDIAHLLNVSEMFSQIVLPDYKEPEVYIDRLEKFHEAMRIVALTKDL